MQRPKYLIGSRRRRSSHHNPYDKKCDFAGKRENKRCDFVGKRENKKCDFAGICLEKKCDSAYSIYNRDKNQHVGNEILYL